MAICLCAYPYVSSSYEDTCHIGLEPHPKSLTLLNLITLKTLFPTMLHSEVLGAVTSTLDFGGT